MGDGFLVPVGTGRPRLCADFSLCRANRRRERPGNKVNAVLPRRAEELEASALRLESGYACFGKELSFFSPAPSGTGRPCTLFCPGGKRYCCPAGGKEQEAPVKAYGKTPAGFPAGAYLRCQRGGRTTPACAGGSGSLWLRWGSWCGSWHSASIRRRGPLRACRDRFPGV